MTLREILNAQSGNSKRQYNEWRRFRWLACEFRNANPYDKKQYEPTDLMKLPGDEEESNFEDDIKEIKRRRALRDGK